MSPTPWTDALALLNRSSVASESPLWMEIRNVLANLTPEKARLADLAEEMLEALEGAVRGMDGGHDESICHVGLTTRSNCRQCQRVDAVRAILAKAEGKGE